MYSLKYGTVPIVRATGGLDDSIEPFDLEHGIGTGFKFKEYSGEEGAEADRAIYVTLDAYTGILYPAPGASASMFANMKAACQSIGERWPNIKPPKGAVI